MRLATGEAAVLKACLDYLGLQHNVFCWRSNNAGVRRTRQTARGEKTFYTFRGLPGVADILGVCRHWRGDWSGRLLAVECKGPKGRLSLAQTAFLEAVCEMGGLSVVVDNVGDLDSFLKDNGVVEP